MASYVLRRLLQMIPLVLLSTLLVFLVIHLMPGDPAMILAGDNASQQDLAAVRHLLGLDKSLPEQYVVWLDQIAHGNLGQSLHSRQAIWGLLQSRVPATLELTLTGMALAMLIAIPLGIVGATHTRGKLEWFISTVQSVWLAIPSFWAGILSIVVFAIILHWLPPGGRVADGADIGDSIKTLILPATCLALYLVKPGVSVVTNPDVGVMMMPA